MQERLWLAAGVGFEPTEPVSRFGGFQGRTSRAHVASASARLVTALLVVGIGLATAGNLV
jgi:hypothetical protein